MLPPRFEIRVSFWNGYKQRPFCLFRKIPNLRIAWHNTPMPTSKLLPIGSHDFPGMMRGNYDFLFRPRRFGKIGTRIRAEVRTHKGRIDALVETASHRYMFEFKLSPPCPPQGGSSNFEGNRRDATLPFTPEEKYFPERAASLSLQPGSLRASTAGAQPSEKSPLPFQDTGKTIVKVGGVFSTQERNIVAWVVG